MIRLRGQLICMTAEERETVLGRVDEHISLTRSEPGCLSFDITQSEDPLIFEVMESFRNRAAFDFHQTRTRDSRWFAATRHILRDFRVEEIGD